MPRSPRYLLTPSAKQDLREINLWIRRQSPAAARRVRARMREAMREIARRPGLGHSRADLADETLRVYVVYRYLIVYRPRSKPLEIVRVIHGARDIGTIFCL